MYILWLAIAAIISYVLAHLLLRWSQKTGLGQQKLRSRDLHDKPTPRIGGFAIVTTFLILMIAIVVIYGDQNWGNFGFAYKIFSVPIDKRLLGILLSATVLSSIMIYDDFKGAPAISKLGFQIISAVILIFTGVGLVYLNNPFGNTIYLDSLKIPFQIGADVYHLVFWADLFLIIWVLLLTNAANFIDGLDGLAVTLSLISIVIIGVLSYLMGQSSTALMCAILSGGIIGFLPFNLPIGRKAKMFLGDTGAMFLGLMLAILTVISGGKLATVLLVFGLAIVDALYVIAKRIMEGKNPLTTADQSHLHHRFIHAGFSKLATLGIITGFSLLFGISGLMFTGRIKIYLLAVLIAGAFIMFYMLDNRSFKSKVSKMK